MKTDISGMNDRQKEAVLYTEGPLAILSVAGSGKTYTVTKKIEYLVKDKGVRPSEIWACTFTNKAANEMKERLEEPLGEQAGRLKIATLHSTAFKILKYLKQRRNPEWRAPKIMVNNIGAFFHLLNYAKAEKFPNCDVWRYMQAISDMKLQLITLDGCKARYPYDRTRDGENSWNECLHKMYFKYQSYLRSSGQMDFQDILMLCCETMEDPDYADDLARLRERISYFIVDESQDTNYVSFRIINNLMLGRDCITIVGDLRQLIYSFQGASLDHITDFITKHDPKIIDLNINYRSTKTIVESANKLISTAKGILGEPAVTPNAKGQPIKYFTSMDTTEEGLAVYDLVKQLTDGGTDYKDIAILYRVHSAAREIEDQLLINDVPYIIQANTHFYLRKEVKDILAYLQIILDKEDCDIKDLKRIANRPTRYLGNKAMEVFNDECWDKDYNLWEGMENVYSIYKLNSREQDAIDRLYSALKGLRQKYVEGATTSDLVSYILEDIGYEKWAIQEISEKFPDQDVGLNLDALLTSVAKFSKPEDFLKFVDDTIRKEKEKKKDEDGNYIKMMTVHASKGKEFKKVILVGVCDRIFPFWKAVDEGNEEEEKRIMYVAKTRPQEDLFLSVIDGKYGRNKVNPSRYLNFMSIDYKGGSNV